MKLTLPRIIFVGLLVLVLALVVLLLTGPKNPTAIIHVQDAAGKPIAGAIIQPNGLRTKQGPYSGGWYSWSAEYQGVTNVPVTTDKDGNARLTYPKYVFEKIETGTLCLEVDHAEFVPELPECVVATAPPAGAPWRVRVQDLWTRIQQKVLVTRPPPVVLNKGGILKISVTPGPALSSKATMFAQVSGLAYTDDTFWTRPEPGVIVTRRLSSGPHTVRAIVLDADGSTWFSDVVKLDAAIGQTNDLRLTLKRGVTVRGQLDSTVPRPVKGGRVIANIWPVDLQPQDSPPQWHAWTTVKEDGTFAIDNLPAGDLEILALCGGFVSTNGPGKSGFRYPQKHLFSTNALEITIGMEPTARLEVTVRDEKGRPLKDVQVQAWPNARYGEWGAVLLMSDRYNMPELFLRKRGARPVWNQPVWDFQGTSDSAGLAVLSNLPPETKELVAENAQFTLPITVTSDGRKNRQANITLVAGQTNRITLQLVPHDRTKIGHY